MVYVVFISRSLLVVNVAVVERKWEIVVFVRIREKWRQIGSIRRTELNDWLLAAAFAIRNFL